MNIQHEQVSEAVFQNMQKLITEKMQAIKYELMDAASGSTQKVENQMDEKYFNLERQLRALSEQNQGSAGVEKLQAGMESRIDDLKAQLSKLQSHVIQIEKSELAKNTDVIQTCLAQLQEFEGRSQSFEETFNERLQDVYR